MGSGRIKPAYQSSLQILFECLNSNSSIFSDDEDKAKGDL